MWLWWYAATLFLGCLVAIVLPLRRLWLILAFALLMLPPFFIPLFRDHGAVAQILWSGLLFLGYVLSWTGGVYAGTEVRRWLAHSLRAAYRKLGGDKGAT